MLGEEVGGSASQLPSDGENSGTKAGLSEDSDKVNKNEEKNKACLLLSHYCYLTSCSGGCRRWGAAVAEVVLPVQ